jgi:hypothetical protein
MMSLSEQGYEARRSSCGKHFASRQMSGLQCSCRHTGTDDLVAMMAARGGRVSANALSADL